MRSFASSASRVPPSPSPTWSTPQPGSRRASQRISRRGRRPSPWASGPRSHWSLTPPPRCARPAYGRQPLTGAGHRRAAGGPPGRRPIRPVKTAEAHPLPSSLDIHDDLAVRLNGPDQGLGERTRRPIVTEAPSGPGRSCTTREPEPLPALVTGRLRCSRLVWSAVDTTRLPSPLRGAADAKAPPVRAEVWSATLPWANLADHDRPRAPGRRPEPDRSVHAGLALRLLRPSLAADGVLSAADLARSGHGSQVLAGVVTHRRAPRASGMMLPQPGGRDWSAQRRLPSGMWRRYRVSAERAVLHRARHRGEGRRSRRAHGRPSPGRFPVSQHRQPGLVLTAAPLLLAGGVGGALASDRGVSSVQLGVDGPEHADRRDPRRSLRQAGGVGEATPMIATTGCRGTWRPLMRAGECALVWPIQPAPTPRHETKPPGMGPTTSVRASPEVHDDRDEGAMNTAPPGELLGSPPAGRSGGMMASVSATSTVPRAYPAVYQPAPAASGSDSRIVAVARWGTNATSAPRRPEDRDERARAPGP